MAKNLLKKAGLKLTCQIPQSNGIPTQIQSGRGIINQEQTMFNGSRLTEIFDSFSRRQLYLQQALIFLLTKFAFFVLFFFIDYEDACDYKKLQDYKITHIINCDPIYCENLFPGQFNYECLEIRDNILFDISSAILSAVALINEIRKVNGRVLIHCQKGISRAPAIMLAYIISEKALNLKQSLDYLKEKYQKADPNIGFMLQLNEFYQNQFEKLIC